MSGVQLSSRSASRHDRDRDRITGGSQAVPLRDPLLGYGRGGSDPQRAWPSTEGAGARIREIRGGRSPLTRDPARDPDAAEFAASLRASRAAKSRCRNDFAGATPASRSVETPEGRGRQGGRRGASVLRACRPLSRGSQSLGSSRTDQASRRRKSKVAQTSPSRATVNQVMGTYAPPALP